jgi:ABC-type polysaccharide/polyol phosphate export permease
MAALRALWAFRGFILGSVQREFQSKYRNSLLGVAWTVINPLAMVTVYTVIFSQVMRARLPAVEGNFAYSIYLCAGIIAWGLFTEIVTRAQNVFLDNANLLKIFRDVGQFSGIALSLWFWCTPIVYPASILPEPVARLMAFNPLAVLTGMYQRLFLGGEADLPSLAPVLALALLFCILGLALFRRHAGDMTDEL